MKDGNQALINEVIDTSLDGDEVKHARKIKMLDKLMWQKIREIVINLIFMLFAYMVAYSFNDVNSYGYQGSLKSLITTKRVDSCIAFEEVKMFSK